MRFLNFLRKTLIKKIKKKSFAQATSLSITSSLASITRDTLKIKETFLNIQSKKIKNIQKII